MKKIHPAIGRDVPKECLLHIGNRKMSGYQKTREVIHYDGSKPPKPGTYTPLFGCEAQLIVADHNGIEYLL